MRYFWYTYVSFGDTLNSRYGRRDAEHYIYVRFSFAVFFHDSLERENLRWMELDSIGRLKQEAVDILVFEYCAVHTNRARTERRIA